MEKEQKLVEEHDNIIFSISNLLVIQPLQHKKAKGEQYGTVPFGFYSQEGRLVKNTQEQATLARLRELRKKGYKLPTDS